MADDYYQSLHAAIPSKPGVKSLTEIKTVLPSDQEILADLPGVIKTWRTVFGV
ncbi:MAG: hypothetical protein WDN49_26505 [Acetobacteraceae bacterium]